MAGCCVGREEDRDPLVNHLSLNNFRHNRDRQKFEGHNCIKRTLKYMSVTLGIWDPNGWGILLSIFMALVCLFQLAYDLFVVCGCPGFDCGFLQKQDEGDRQHHNSTHKPFRETSNTVYTLASLGGFFSYTLLLICLRLIRRRRHVSNNKALGPTDVLEDLSNTHLKVLCGSLMFTASLFFASVVLFYYIIHSQPSGTYFDWLVVGVGSQFLAQWAGIVACHVFAMCTFAMSTLADDTIRRIKGITCSVADDQAGNIDVTEGAMDHDETSPEAITPHNESDEHNEGVSTSQETAKGDTKNQNIDLAIDYHEELCAMVSDTVSAFCPWFIAHWLLYGSTCLLAIVYLSEEISYSTRTINIVYIGCFVLTHVVMFLMPCCCAAYITDACGDVSRIPLQCPRTMTPSRGIHARINKTTSKTWSTGHPFKDRARLMLFTSYAKDRQCVFKIGRVTFTSNLAWISLLLGSVGLLFHFF